VTRRHERRRTIRGLALIAAIGLVVGVVPATPVRAADDKLPDLRAARTTTFRIRTTSSGRRLLRFTSQMVNFGKGPMELRSTRATTSSPWTVKQRIYDTAGGSRDVTTDATLAYAGDGHDHWHVRRLMTYHLWGLKGTYRDAKIGFCFFDTTPRDLAMPGSPNSRVYRESTCGVRRSLNSKTGLSVGWGDTYPWDFAYQWVDITGLPGGTYTLRTVVDLYGSFLETSETNNCTWTKVRFNSTGSSVSVVSTGSGCIDDWSTSTFAGDIDWLFDEGITAGCDADLFCTYNPVSRGEMATFLSRALDLPTTTTDHFTDDESSVHEGAINSLAEAGLTVGCAVGRYCPTRDVSRGQMASFLARALDLPTTPIDHFTDDDGTTHENDIDAIAEAGITTGCSATRFCPRTDTTRGAMAAFLHRAFGEP
jgi:hypothetical protein